MKSPMRYRGNTMILHKFGQAGKVLLLGYYKQ